MTLPFCPSCQRESDRKIAEFREVPVLCNQLFESPEAARNARCGNIELALCAGCGLIWNRAFDPTLVAYAQGYENALHHSPHFRDFAEALVQRLVSDYGLTDGTVVEIGCGDGYVLNLFARLGVKSAIGYDPSMEGRVSAYSNREGVEIHAQAFDATTLRDPADLVLCRHVLEHLDTPRLFLDDVAHALGARTTPLYFEVPNAEWMLMAPSPWDVIYEHVTYWTEASLCAAFRAAGLRPVSLVRGYGDQFLSIEAEKAETAGEKVVAPCDLEPLQRVASGFADYFHRETQRWEMLLEATDGPVVIWGAGSKGITFANVMAHTGSGFAAMVDVNPQKHGRFIPGTGTQVIAPSAVADIAPALILISNGLYKDEIASDLRTMGLEPKFEVIST
ncbi:class I SAM-dependent methyltransferase [Tropicimonas sp. S265A]|uniref:class I SAM-dependent methyltransferase n=1 Tax=Tropicimonas sp. S265A TaxID=3415134 RepID=UPI003C7E0BDD